MAHVGIAYERYEDVLCAVDLATFAESMASDHHTHTVNGSVNVRIVQIHSTNKNMLCSPYSFTLFPLKSKYIFLKINRIILYGCGIFFSSVVFKSYCYYLCSLSNSIHYKCKTSIWNRSNYMLRAPPPPVLLYF